MMKLIDDVKGAWKLLSVQIAAIWALVAGVAAADPMLFVTAWNAIPPELREFLPPWVRWIVAASALFGTIYAARIIKQPVTDKGKEAELKRHLIEGVANLSPEEAEATAKRIVELQKLTRDEKRNV